MKAENIINAVKEFFFDIIGYFAPGFFAILLLSYCILPVNKINPVEMGLNSEWLAFVIIFLSYVLGYVIYSLSEFSDKIIFSMKFLGIKSPSQLESDITNSKELAIVKIALKELLIKKDNSLVIEETAFDNLDSRRIRSIAMSYIPESDIKIYTFMFRAEICKNICSFSLFFALVGLLFSLVGCIAKSPILFRNDVNSLLIYSILLVSCIFFTKTRMRFLTIAYTIPFPMFIAKYYKIK